MIVRRILLLAVLFSIAVTTFSGSENADFDSLCELIQDVMKLELEPQARFEYTNKHIDSRVDSNEVKEAYQLIFQINANQRYKVFKQAVESRSNQSWECTALNDFFK